MANDQPVPMTVQEAGRKGGIKARDNQVAKDPDYYRKLGAKGGAATTAKKAAAEKP